MRSIKFLLVIALTGVIFTNHLDARWWIFGKKRGKPEITNVIVAGMNVYDIDRKIIVNKDMLESDGKILIKGATRKSDNGKVVAVKVSIDNGKIWENAKVSDKGSFIFRFKPQVREKYILKFQAIDEVGAKSDLNDVPYFELEYTDKSVKDFISDTLKELVNYYNSENINSFMNLISKSYQGDYSALKNAIKNDFISYSNLKLSVTLINIIKQRNNVIAYVRYNWQGYDLKNGITITKSPQNTEIGFVQENGKYKILYMKSPVMFGVTSSREIASDTSGTEVNPSYNGTITLRSYNDSQEGFVFDTQEILIVKSGEPADIWNAGTAFSAYLIKDMGAVSLSSVKECPLGSSGYQSSPFIWDPPAVGRTYCVMTRKGKYAKIYVSYYSNKVWKFSYVYNPDGSNKF